MSLTNLQRVRLLIYDRSDGSGNPNYTDEQVTAGTAEPVFSDEEVNDFLDQYTTGFDDYPACLFASADLCEARAATAVERSVSASVGGTLTHKSERLASEWRQLAKQYRERVTRILSGADEQAVIEIAEPGGSEFQQLDVLERRFIAENL